MSQSAAPQVRYVVFHRPGPAWQAGVDFREQPGVREHVAHYRQLYEQGRLQLGGPFLLADSGGMMIPTAIPSRTWSKFSTPTAPWRRIHTCIVSW